ncbi:glutamate receptor, ionotropic kainate 2 [Plakobranchus ocellatus]|uniref:Glutamate receptor, ionotropic kainate 2 n=1 Tax=Plakobranchus ocellatus TaxID=259542 RepID=A0AAV4BVN2_9GAST|nr:glutamate receptor, ionotropic kainate 2 [Plakobranchus ocellatus]
MWLFLKLRCIYPVLILGFLSVATQSTPTHPVVAVVISKTTADYNSNLVAIFDKVYKNLKMENGSRVEFKPIVTTNVSHTMDTVCTTLESGVSILIDMSTPQLSNLLKSVCVTFGVTYVSVLDRSYYGFGGNGQESEIDVSVAPVSMQMLKIVADIARAEELNDIAIIYDDTFDIQNTPRHVLTNVAAQHVHVKLETNADLVEETVNTLESIGIKSFFIIAGRLNAEAFFTAYSKTSILNFSPNIFVLTKDSKLNCGQCRLMANVLLITAKSRVDARRHFIDYMRNGIDNDAEVDNIKADEAMAFDIARLISRAVAKVSYDHGEFINIKGVDCKNPADTLNSNNTQAQDVVSYMKQASTSGVLGTFSWDETENSIIYQMSLTVSRLRFSMGMLQNRVLVANWTKADGLQKTAPLVTNTGRKNYRVVTVTGMPPFVYKYESANGTGQPMYDGYCIQMLQSLAEEMDFDYTIYDVETVGSMDEDGNWDGAIKELLEGRADIAVGPISVMAERENVIDFTVPYYDLVGLTILMKKPEFDYSLVKFLSVMDEEVWGCIIGAFVLFSGLISVFDKLSPFSNQNRKSEPWQGVNGAEPRIFTLKESIWFCMMSLTPQGGGETPRALSGRLIAATWWLFGFIIIATYTANLAAFLTVSRLETPIESLDDLSKQFKVQYAPENGSVAMTYFQRMAQIEYRFYEIWKNMSLDESLGAVERAKLAVWDYPVSDKYTKLWSIMKTSGFPDNAKAAVERVLEGNFAFICKTIIVVIGLVYAGRY